MHCIDGYWDYIARCSPGLTKTGTNITILIKDTVEVHKSEFNYTSPIHDSLITTGEQITNKNSVNRKDDWFGQNRYNLSESYLDSLFNTNQTAEQWIKKLNLSDAYLNWMFNRSRVTDSGLYNGQFVPITDLNSASVNNNNDDDDIDIDVRFKGESVKPKNKTLQINISNSNVYINTNSKEAFRG